MLLVTAAGCTSAVYDSALQESVKRHQGDSEFQRLQPEPQRIADDRFFVRVPKLFQKVIDVADVERAKPPFLKNFPGFRIGFESILEVEGTTKLPVVLSIGVLTDKDASLDSMKTIVQDQVRKEPAFAKEQWGQPDPASGVGAGWSIMRLRGPQPFDREVAGNPETKSTDGETQIWLGHDPDKKVAALLVWRVPEELASAVSLEVVAPLVIRTAEYKPLVEPEPAAAAAPAP